MMQQIRVLIVDDQTLVREGFRKLIEMEPDFEVVGMAGDGEEALSLTEDLYARQTPPDVILMDIRMPRLDGIAATRQLRARWPETQIVILTTFDEAELIHAGLQAGALGYALKDITAEQLAATIRAAAQRQVLLQSAIASKAFAAFAPSVSAPEPLALPPTERPTPYQTPMIDPLTEREREILALVAQGASNRQISEKLFITEGTVKNHLSNILGKLHVRDRTQAALKARELGLG